MKFISFINLLVISLVVTPITRIVSLVVTPVIKVINGFHKNNLRTLNLDRIQEIRYIGYPLNFRLWGSEKRSDAACMEKSSTFPFMTTVVSDKNISSKILSDPHDPHSLRSESEVRLHENLLYDYNPIINKTQEIIKLTRLENNLIPTSILTLIGGFVTNPSSWKVWIYSPAFLAGYSMVIIMTATSMIINDIYDIDIDKINNPNRPLVKGTVTLFEAKTLIIILLSIYSYLGIKYLPPILNTLWIMSILLTVLYTPILKKLCFIKNLTCASIVSSTIPFIGLTTLVSRVATKDTIINPLQEILPDFSLMFITSKIIFICSLYIEILLDISDEEGDAKANINTIPVLFGKDKTIYIVKLILLFSNINFLYDIIKLNNPILFIGIILSFSLCYLNLINIKNNSYSKQSIMKALKETNISLILFLSIILFELRFR